MEQEKAVLDTKLLHNGMLHGWINNGGTIKLNNRFGVEIKYNDNNPTSPMIEMSIFIIPLGTTFTGKINPSLARAAATQQKQERERKAKEQLFVLEEGDVIEG